MVDFYKILDVAEDASQQEIRKAYQRKAFQHHPDLNPGDAKTAQQRFREITEAYQVLRDTATRSQYDSLRRRGYTSAEPDYASSYHPRSPYTDADFDRAFDEWWRKMGQGCNHDKAKERKDVGCRFQEYAEHRKERERSEFQRRARAAAWEREKEEAQLNKARSERVRQRTEDARHARHAAILRRFWQTHSGVTWVDAAVAGLVLLSVSGLAYSWKIHLGRPLPQRQASPHHEGQHHPLPPPQQAQCAPDLRAVPPGTRLVKGAGAAAVEGV